MPRRVGPLEAELALERGVIVRDVVGVGRPDESLRRVVKRGQLVAAPDTRPLESPIARNREQSVPVGSLRRETGCRPADVALRVGVHLVQRRRAPAHERGLERLEVLGAHVIERAEVRAHAGLEPTGSHGEGASLLLVEMDDGAVAREDELDLARRLALYRDRLSSDAQRFPSAVVLVLLAVGIGC